MVDGFKSKSIRLHREILPKNVTRVRVINLFGVNFSDLSNGYQINILESSYIDGGYLLIYQMN